MVRPGAAVVGAGMTMEGRRVIPDVDEACAEVAGWITPRLGGVGPTTRAMLLRNAVEAAERASAGHAMSTQPHAAAAGRSAAVHRLRHGRRRATSRAARRAGCPPPRGPGARARRALGASRSCSRSSWLGSLAIVAGAR